MINLLARISGSGAMHYKGIDFWAKDIAATDVVLSPFAVKSDAYGVMSSRAASRVVTVKFTPVGQWTAGMLAVLFPYQNPQLGDYNTPIRAITSVDTTHGNLVAAAHGQVTGTGVRLGVAPGGSMPGGFSVGMTYYLWCNADGNTVQFYDTEAHALAANGFSETTGKVMPISAGTGTLRFIVNTPLTITTADGVELVLWNAAITKQPELVLGPTESPLGEVEMEGYTLHGAAWSDAGSIYSYSTGEALTAPVPDQTEIASVQFTVDWTGPAGALLTGLTPSSAVKVSQEISWSVVKGSNGIDAKRLKSFKASASVAATNVDYGALLNALAFEGGTAGPGQALVAGNLDIYAASGSPFVRIYGAALENAPARFGADADRVDALRFVSGARTFGGTAPSPGLYVGVAAPTS